MGNPNEVFHNQEACELVYGAGQCIEATDQYWYPKSLLKVAIAPSSAPTLDFNPIDLVKSAFHDLSGPVTAVEKWVLKQLSKVATLIENDISKLHGYLSARLGGVENTISHLAGEVSSTVGSLGGDARKVLDSLRHDIAAAVDSGVHKAEAELSTVEKEAKTLGHDAEHYADAALKTFERDVIRPLERDLRTAIHDAESAAEDAWHVWYKDIWAPADKIIHDAEHDAHKAIYFIDHSALDAIHLIDECWDWLLWMAKNSAEALEELPAKMLARLTLTGLEAHGATVTSGWDSLVTELDKKFPND